MKVLKQVIEQWGFIDKIQLAEIAEHVLINRLRVQ